MLLSEEHAEIVKTLWLQRISAGDIVKYFGGVFTRSQILGKIYRMGLMRTKNPNVIRENRRRIRRQRAKEPTMLRPVLRSDGLPPAKPIPMPTPSNAAQRSFNDLSGPSYSLADLNLFDCRWPIGDPQQRGFCYCAAPVVRLGPYCHHHTKIAYTAPVRR